MFKDYIIQRCDLIKGRRWIVFKRYNKHVNFHVYSAMTKKECVEWVKNEIKTKIRKGRKKNEK